jgi:hypothetical protein
MSGMIYELAVVQDRGTHWKVTNVTKNTLDNQAVRNESVIKLSYMSYKLIQEALMAGNAVHIQKTLRTDEVLPGEFEIIEHETADPVSDAKDAAIIRIRMLVTPEISKISGLAMYGFIVLNNDLSAMGYFITNDNREEKYLEILETGDEVLISKLEDYLNYKDEIEAVAQLERKFSAFRANVQRATTVDEVEALQTQFLERFYLNY